MDKELIINVTSKGSEVALLEDKKLVELHQEKKSKQFNVGDVYLGRVKKIIPGLNAAFVDVGYSKDAFLHYTDLGPTIRSMMKMTRYALDGKLNDDLLNNFKYEEEIVKTGNISDVLKAKQPILVQIIKEPISTKGPRLSCEVTIPGRHLVLSPFTKTVGVSRRISSSEERKRLKILVESLKPKNFGIVVRTVATTQGAATLHNEIEGLCNNWKKLIATLKNAQAPTKILSELDKSSSIVRDLLNDSFNRVISNKKELSNELENYITRIIPEKKDIVKTYDGNVPIFDNFGITKQIKATFGKTVTMASGAYLVIEHTEAMHVVDVNSGHKLAMGGDQESNALKVNLESAREVARQLRLRDIGGIITIDFIDMRKPDNKKAVYAEMKEAMSNDRATNTILPLSKFNLMQITRQRVRPQVNITTTEQCPSCQGTGKVESTLLLIEDIERNLNFVLQKHKGVKLSVHPFIEAYLTKGFKSKKVQWSLKHKSWLKLLPNNDYGLTEYRFFNKDGDEIEI